MDAVRSSPPARGRRAGARLLVHAGGGLEGTLGDLELDARAVAAVEVVISWPAPALERLGAIDRATYIAVLSNDPKIDDEIRTQHPSSGRSRRDRRMQERRWTR